MYLVAPTLKRYPRNKSMTRASRRKKKEKDKSLDELAQEIKSEGPWLSWRTGLLTNSVISLILALFVGWQIYPAGGLGEALLWGGIAGVSIWVVFSLAYLVNRFLRGG
jgi:hypothetical protein